jgi:tRNA(fMet)-specific endonuclease VapC
MMPQKALLDTDTLSAIMKKNPAALAQAQQYLRVYSRFTFSIITRYEVLRGLKAKQASRQLVDFGRLCDASEVVPLTDEIVVRAADIYADLKRRGELISDADILIGASALSQTCSVITRNENHFKRISGLNVENWIPPKDTSGLRGFHNGRSSPDVDDELSPQT